VTAVAKMTISLSERDKDKIMNMKIKLNNAGIKISLSKLAVKAMTTGLREVAAAERVRLGKKMIDLSGQRAWVYQKIIKLRF
jgi:hypothetical protein